jgi:hypothetical protein
MATPTTDAKLCKIVQTALGLSYDPLISQSQKPITGFIDALVNPLNTQGVVAVQESVSGATTRPGTTNGRKVLLRGMNADCTTCSPSEDEFDRCNWTGAASANIPTTYQYSVDLSSCVQTRTFALSDIFALCDDPQSIITDNLRQMAAAIQKDANAKLINKAIGLMGTYNDGNDSKVNPKTLNLLGANCASVNFNEINKIAIEFNKSSFVGTPMVVGGDTIAQLKMYQGNLGLNQNGVNISGAMFPNMFLDYNVDTTYDDGDAHILTFMPKTFQLVEWFENEQIMSKFRGAIIEVDGKQMFEEEWSVVNIDGAKFDMFMKYDKCGGYTIGLHKWIDLAEVPVDAVCNYPAVQYLVAAGAGSCI